MKFITFTFVILGIDWASAFGPSVDLQQSKKAQQKTSLKQDIVFGGNAVPSGDEDAHLAIQFSITYEDGSSGLCSGTLIEDNRHLITAGHCADGKVVETKDAKGNVVASKIVKTAKMEAIFDKGSPNEKKYPIKKPYKIHPQFRSNNKMEGPSNDVALLTLDKDLTAPSGYTPLPIYDVTKCKLITGTTGTKVLVIGYGLSNPNNEKSYGVLNEALVRPSSIQMDLGTIKVDQVEAGACPGDSGGPMIGKCDDVYSIISITSTGGSKCSSSVYTILKTRENWIRQTIQDEKTEQFAQGNTSQN